MLYFLVKIFDAYYINLAHVGLQCRYVTTRYARGDFATEK